MKNNHIIAASALMLASAAALTSCQSEEDFDVKPAGGEVHLTLTANRAEVNSRTSFEQSEGNLITNWNEGDQLVVLDEAGTNLGVLTITDGQNTPDGVFEGNVTLGDLEYVNIVYLGSAYEGNLAEASGKIVFDIAQQDGTFASLTNWDYLYQTTEVTKINGTEATASVEMVRSLAHGYFNLDLPNGVTLSGGDAVTITAAEGFYSQRTLNLKGLSISHQATANTVTVTMAEDGNDFYLTVIPQAFAPKFTVVKDGVTYTASLPSRTWKPAEYVRADVNNAPVQISDWSFEAAGEADHSKNPLAKWAESDLKRVGSGASATGDFTGDPTITGYYYQFGRNHGFSSVADAQSSYGVERSDMAANRNIYPGTGSTTKVSTYYASSINFTNYPTYFFIDNNHGGDYTTPSRGQSWNERAKSMGYTNEDPSPAGWRLPTVAEYKEILPAIDGKAGNQGANAWSTLSQFKTLADGTKCAFRWSKSTSGSYSYLNIKCLVVPANFDDLDAVDWSDENVVSRSFKGAGYINAHRNLWQLNSSGVVTTHYTARPMKWGLYGGQAQTNGTVVVSVTKDYMNYGGFYWTSDAVQGVFSLIFNSSTGYTLGYYLSQYDNPMGCNIRCIKAE